MIWRTDKPTEKVIVAKLTEDFCHMKDSYAILRLANEPYQHYCEYGEEIPYTAIEKWASLEEKKLPEGLEEAAKKIAYDVCKDLPNGEEKDSIVYYAISAAIAGAEWMAGQYKTLGETKIYFEDDGGEPPYTQEWLDLETTEFKIPEGFKAGDKVIVQIRKK